MIRNRRASFARGAAVLALVAIALVVALAGTAARTEARVQDEDAGQCWHPDNEFPVPCDEDEE